MAFCKQCGAELKEGQQFCSNCGTAVTSAEPSPNNNGTEVTKPEASPNNNGGTENVSANSETKKASSGKKKGLKITLIVVVILLVAFIALMIVVGRAAKTINVDEYTTVEFTGYDSMGKAKVNFDEEKFLADFVEKSNLKDKPKSINDIDSLEELFGVGLSYYTIEEHIEPKLDKEDGLSNGDEVTLTWEIDEAYLKENYGVRVKSSEQTVTDMYEAAIKECEKDLKKCQFGGVKLSLDSSETVGTMVMKNKEGNGDCTCDLKDVNLYDHDYVEILVGKKFSGGTLHKFALNGFESLEEANTYAVEKYQDEYDIDSNLAGAAE